LLIDKRPLFKWILFYYFNKKKEIMMEIKSKLVGKVGKIVVSEGSVVSEGDKICFVESTKLTQPIKSNVAGKVTKILVKQGDKINAGDIVCNVEEASVGKSDKKVTLTSSFVGKVGKLNVSVGDKIEVGDVFFKVENGKLTQPFKSTEAGTVEKILVKEGDDIKTKDELVVINVDGGDDSFESTLKFDLKSTVPILTVGKVNASVGDVVNEGDIILKVEAGKLSEPVKAKETCKIVRFLVKEGDTVKNGDAFAEVAKASAKKAPKKAVERGEIKCDLAILGSGPGGYQAAIYAAKQNLNVVVIEKGHLGGTCLNVGCIPTKSLIHCADVYRDSITSEDFGVTNRSTSYSLKGMVAHKDAVVSELRNGVGTLFEHGGITLVRGKGEFVDANTIKVAGEENAVVKFDKCIIATGSSIAKLPIEGIDLDCVWDSDKVLSNTEEFDSITIVGGGVIGMEFASIFSTLGKTVNVVEFLPEILAVVDDDMIEVVKSNIQVNYFLNSGVKKIEKKDGKAIVTYEHEGKLSSLESDKVLVAVGRHANIKGINLEAAGVELDERGRAIKIDDYLKTNVSNIYAIGDVTAKLQLAHVASNQGFCAVDNILGNKRKMDYINVPSVIFTHPEIATIGWSEKMLIKEGVKYTVKKAPFLSNGKALSMGATQGFVKLIQDDKTKKVIGGAIIGADAGNLIATLTVQISNNIDANDVAQTVFAHPTLAEVVNDAERGFGHGSIHGLDE